MTIVALTRDLMDRSKIAGRTDVTIVNTVRRAVEAEADVIVVDLGAVAVDDLAALVAAAPVVIGFGPHVDHATLDAARRAGFAEVMARSVFFSRLDAVLDSAVAAAAGPSARN